MPQNSPQPTKPYPPDSAPASGWMPVWVGMAFFALAGWFLLGPDMLDIPDKKVTSIDPELLSTAPRRAILSDPPTIRIDGFDRTCMDCHQLFPPRPDPPVALAQHKHIVLDHGINKQCRNCHHPENRNLLVMHGGETIGYDHVEQLCAKCHGPTYRDWQRGSHGRTNGYWDSSRGEVRRIRCTECHDPHNPRVPAMDPIAPLPGPDTLRMKHDLACHDDREGDHHLSQHRDPLRRAIESLTRRERANAEQSEPNGHSVEYFDETQEEND